MADWLLCFSTHFSRSNASDIATIKENRPDHKLPVGLLSGGGASVHDAVAKFTRSRIADSHNDKMPKNSRRVSLRTKQLLTNDNVEDASTAAGAN